MILCACRTGVPGKKRAQLCRKNLVYKENCTRTSVRLVAAENVGDSDADGSDGDNVMTTVMMNKKKRRNEQPFTNIKRKRVQLGCQR
jgi:hypothetical protein